MTQSTPQSPTQTNGVTQQGAAHAETPKHESASKAAPNLHDRLTAAAKAAADAAAGGKNIDEAASAGAEHAKQIGDVEAEVAEGVAAAEETAAKKKGEPAAEPAENPIERVRRELRAREKARTIELEAEMRRDEVTREQQEFNQQRQAFQQEQQKFQKMMQQFASDPMAALEANGWNRDKLAEHFAKAGTPEHAMAQRLEAIEQQNKQLVAYITQTEEQRQQAAQAAEKERITQARSTAEREFVEKHATPEKAPSLHALAKATRQGDKFIVDRAEEVAAWFKNQTGKYPSWEVLADYLEQQAAEDLKGLGGGAPTKAPKPAGKSTATTRTLSQEMISERRSAVAPAQNMSKAERLAAMEQAAIAARRGAG